MLRTIYKPEEIIAKLRQVEVLTSQAAGMARLSLIVQLDGPIEPGIKPLYLNDHATVVSPLD
jgi:hypothetical protein